MQETETRLGYEPALRVIGRHLDNEPAYNVSLLEVADGFTVRSHPSGHRSEGRTIHFSWDRLRDLVIFQAAGRGVPRRRPRHSGIWAHFPNGHEDFFRALGHIIDEEGGGSLSVDEVPEGIAVSYMHPREDDGVLMEKRHSLFRSEDVEQLLRDAQQRRNESRASKGRKKG